MVTFEPINSSKAKSRVMISYWFSQEWIPWSQYSPSARSDAATLWSRSLQRQTNTVASRDPETTNASPPVKPAWREYAKHVTTSQWPNTHCVNLPKKETEYQNTSWYQFQHPPPPPTAKRNHNNIISAKNYAKCTTDLLKTTFAITDFKLQQTRSCYTEVFRNKMPRVDCIWKKHQRENGNRPLSIC